jgi:hypothetical protein
MKEFVVGSHYTLEAFPDYWGEKPAFKTVHIEITPSLTTQKLQLDQGAYDLVTKGFAIPDVLNYMKNSGFNVINAFGGASQALWLNPTSGVFTDKTLRKAMATALDRKSIVQTAYSGICHVQEGVWPDAMFPPAIAPFPDVYDTAPLKALAPALRSKKLTRALERRRRRADPADGRAGADPARHVWVERERHRDPDLAAVRPGQPVGVEAAGHAVRRHRRRRAARRHWTTHPPADGR